MLNFASPTDYVLDEVARERERQESLKEAGKFPHTCADLELSSGDKLACLGEEFGEVCNALCHWDPEAGSLREELIHVAAVAVGWIEALDKE